MNFVADWTLAYWRNEHMTRPTAYICAENALATRSPRSANIFSMCLRLPHNKVRPLGETLSNHPRMVHEPARGAVRESGL